MGATVASIHPAAEKAHILGNPEGNKEPGLLDPGHIVLLTLDAARNIMGRYEEHEGVHPLLGTRSI